jgi:drug/metabolite transporter (DMT)-like permease
MRESQAQHLPHPAQAPLRFGVTALILGNLFLSFGPMFVRMADSGPVATAFWRVGLAVPLLFLIARKSDGPIRFPTKHLAGLLILSGVLFAADLAAWHIAIPLTKLANANLLGNSTSFLLPLWMFIVTRSWPSGRQAAALGLAVLGAVLMMGGSFELSADHLIGDLLCILAGAFYTAYLVLMGRARNSTGQWPTLAWSTLMSVPPLLIMAIALGETIVPTDWTPVLLLALCSQIAGQGLMIYAVGRVSPVLFGITLLVQPLVSATIGFFLYREALGPVDLIGAALIAVALLLVRQPEGKT